MLIPLGMNFGHCASPAVFNVVTRAIQWIVDTQPTDWWLRDGRVDFVHFRARPFDPTTADEALGDRARVRIYSDPFPVAAPPDSSDTSFSPSLSSLLDSQAE